MPAVMKLLAMLGDSITTDHISPAGSIKKDTPAGKYLMDNGVMPGDEMMATITRPIEEAMKDIPGAVTVRSSTGRTIPLGGWREVQVHRERREVEASMQEEALADVAQVEDAGVSDQFTLCLYREEWHQGVVGIVASRLKEEFEVPSFVLALCEDGLALLVISSDNHAGATAAVKKSGPYWVVLV